MTVKKPTGDKARLKRQVARLKSRVLLLESAVKLALDHDHAGECTVDYCCVPGTSITELRAALETP